MLSGQQISNNELTLAPNTLVLDRVDLLQPGLALGDTRAKLAVLGREAADTAVGDADGLAGRSGDGVHCCCLMSVVW
jgi:hypothetical protein